MTTTAIPLSSVSSIARVLYNSTTGWPARPNVLLVPAGQAEYLSLDPAAPTPSDMQLGDTLDIVPTLPANTVLPAITGTAQVGSTLTASTGTWTNSPTSYTYQWYADGSAIPGATASTYTLQAAEIGAAITVGVTATTVSGGQTTATSAATAAVVGIVAFTNTIANWTGAFNNSSVAADATKQHDGTSSVKITSTATATTYGANSTSAGRQNVTAGKPYKTTVYIYTDTANRQSTVSVVFRDAGGSSVAGGTKVSPITALTAGAWTAVVCTFTPPATTTKVEATPNIQYTNTAQSVPSGDIAYLSGS